MTTNDDTSNRKLGLFKNKKNNPETNFLKVRYTCMLSSGMEGNFMKKRLNILFYLKGERFLL